MATIFIHTGGVDPQSVTEQLLYGVCSKLVCNNHQLTAGREDTGIISNLIRQHPAGAGGSYSVSLPPRNLGENSTPSMNPFDGIIFAHGRHDQILKQATDAILGNIMQNTQRPILLLGWSNTMIAGMMNGFGVYGLDISQRDWLENYLLPEVDAFAAAIGEVDSARSAGGSGKTALFLLRNLFSPADYDEEAEAYLGWRERSAVTPSDLLTQWIERMATDAAVWLHRQLAAQPTK